MPAAQGSTTMHQCFIPEMYILLLHRYVCAKEKGALWLSHGVTTQPRHGEACSHSGSTREEPQGVRMRRIPVGDHKKTMIGARGGCTTFMEAVTKGQKGLVGHPILSTITGHQ